MAEPTPARSAIFVAVGAVLVLAVAAAAFQSPSAHAPIATGPEVGQRIPPFRAPDQTGKLQDLASLRGPKGAVIYFNRSVDWWPYCKSQLVELQRYVEQFRRQGLGVAVITYDSVEILADFARRHNITIPLLSDPDSSIIRAFGILNETIPRDHMYYGVPHPGAYVVDPNGVVKSKYFEQAYQDRYAAPTILLREFGSVPGARRTEVQTDYLTMRYYPTTEVVHPNLRFTLVADFVLPPKMHVYTPEVRNYIPIRLRIEESPYYTVHEADYPKGQLLHLPAINEVVPVYENQFRITQDITLAAERVLEPLLRSNQPLKITGSLRYQACDDKICYLPQTIPLELNLRLEPLDRQRVPEAIQHK